MALLLFAEGGFGAAVAARVSAAVPAVRVLPFVQSAESFDAHVRGAGFVGVALWRRYPSLADRLDEACTRQAVPWSGVTLEGPQILCGPVVTPGRGACYACFRKRWFTHLPHPDRDRALDAAYEADPRSGVAGFTPSAVRMAAAALRLDMEDLSHAGGRVRRIDLIQCSVEDTRVVRIHGCARCSIERTPGDRYVRNLIHALNEMS